MELKDYFMDTYAIIEIIKGNKNYSKFLNSNLHTSFLNLYELYYILLKDYGEVIAEKYFYRFKQNVVKIDDFSIFEASKFKLANNRRSLSYVDALGYAISLNRKILFLTGDKEFKDMKNVEFVK